MKKIGFMIDDGYHDLEFWVPYYRLKEENIPFDVLAWEERAYKGIYGIDPVKPTQLLSDLPGKYDVLILPGAKSPENLMKNPKTIDVVKKMYSDGTSFATICHSPLLLAAAGLLNGKKITGHSSIKPGLDNAGAIYVDSPFLWVSDKILSGRTHFDLDIFMPQLMKLVR